MKNKNSSKILVALATAFIIVIGALSGYFLVSSVKNGSPLLSENNEDKSTDLDEDSDDTKNNNDDAQNKDDDTSKEESRREENYTGPTICQVDQYIYNSDGKIIKDFHDGERYYLEMTVNADASEAIGTNALRIAERSFLPDRYRRLAPQRQSHRAAHAAQPIK